MTPFIITNNGTNWLWLSPDVMHWAEQSTCNIPAKNASTEFNNEETLDS